jgi:hypothetical protein
MRCKLASQNLLVQFRVIASQPADERYAAGRATLALWGKSKWTTRPTGAEFIHSISDVVTLRTGGSALFLLVHGVLIKIQKLPRTVMVLPSRPELARHIQWACDGGWPVSRCAWNVPPS